MRDPPCLEDPLHGVLELRSLIRKRSVGIQHIQEPAVLKISRVLADHPGSHRISAHIKHADRLRVLQHAGNALGHDRRILKLNCLQYFYPFGFQKLFQITRPEQPLRLVHIEKANPPAAFLCQMDRPVDGKFCFSAARFSQKHKFSGIFKTIQFLHLLSKCFALFYSNFRAILSFCFRCTIFREFFANIHTQKTISNGSLLQKKKSRSLTVPK